MACLELLVNKTTSARVVAVHSPGNQGRSTTRPRPGVQVFTIQNKETFPPKEHGTKKKCTAERPTGQCSLHHRALRRAVPSAEPCPRTAVLTHLTPCPIPRQEECVAPHPQAILVCRPCPGHVPRPPHCLMIICSPATHLHHYSTRIQVHVRERESRGILPLHGERRRYHQSQDCGKIKFLFLCRRVPSRTKALKEARS